VGLRDSHHLLDMSRSSDATGHERTAILVDPLTKSTSGVKSNHGFDREIEDKNFCIELMNRQRLKFEETTTGMTNTTRSRQGI